MAATCLLLILLLATVASSELQSQTPSSPEPELTTRNSWITNKLIVSIPKTLECRAPYMRKVAVHFDRRCYRSCTKRKGGPCLRILIREPFCECMPGTVYLNDTTMDSCIPTRQCPIEYTDAELSVIRTNAVTPRRD